MIVLSNSFGNLENIPKMYTYNDKNYNPSIYWSGYNPQANAFLVIMENLDTKKIHWTVLLDNSKNFIDIGEITGGEVINYIGPNDIDDIVLYTITVYAIINPQLKYDLIIQDNNVLNKATIKFLYNSFK